MQQCKYIRFAIGLSVSHVLEDVQDNKEAEDEIIV